MIGRRHNSDCFCGCQFVEGLRGKTIETIRVVRFMVPCVAGGPPREQLVAYSDLRPPLELADASAREAGD